MKNASRLSLSRVAVLMTAAALTVAAEARADDLPADSAGRAMSALEAVVSRQGGAPARVAAVTTPPRGSWRAGASDRYGLASVPFATVNRDAPDVFGSTSLRVGRTPLDQRWQRVSVGAARALDASARRFVASIRHLDRRAQVDAVNGWVNARVTFRSDREGHDVWADAAQTLRTGRGDCEDYAITKMQLLRALGHPATSLYFVVAQDLVRRQGHAVLVVRHQGTMLMLDSSSDRIQDATRRADYRPILSFSADRAWIHGYAGEGIATRMASAGNPDPGVSL
ncbi:transglutaminase-like cysteine peptidase [Sphingomonas adhaesiva]|uniref:transglutaminase-like cysteine peptidase n=1 Tax=Sphingomonas adhaesiva TaxID=28212 RepID=UPI002FF9928E